MAQAEIEHLKARVRNLAFISEEDAAWLAVRTLISATAINVNFDYYYFCSLAIEARNRFLTHGVRDHLWPAPGMSLLHLEQEVRKAVEYATLSKEKVGRDVVVLGNVVWQISKNGLGKVAAIRAVDEMYTQSANHLIKNSDGAKAQNFKQLGERTITSLWAQYESVLPYVFELYLNLRASASNVPMRLGISELQRAPWDFLNILSEANTTRPIRIKRLKCIDFV